MPVTVTSFTTPTGTLVPTLSGGNYNAPFANSATFTAASGGTCAPGEYRQYVQGSFMANGSTLTHVLCGSVVLLPTTFLEDGCPSGSCTAYGHRSCPTNPLDSYTPTQATGCNFSMSDAPGFTNVRSGVTYTVSLDFKGTLIDTSAGNRVLRENLWKVAGSARATVGVEGAAAVSLTPNDQILMAYHTRNADSGAPELHIIITRPAGQPPLDANSLGLTLRDGSGGVIRPSSAPIVHEIAGKARSTANVVYTLAQGSNTPAAVDLAVNHGLVTIRVQPR